MLRRISVTIISFSKKIINRVIKIRVFLYLNIVVGAIPAVLHIEVLEFEANQVILVHLYQPLAVQLVLIILRVIRGGYDASVDGEFTAANDRYASVARVETPSSVSYVRIEFDEHFIPEAGVHHRFVGIADHGQLWCICVLATENRQLVEVTTRLFLRVDLKIEHPRWNINLFLKKKGTVVRVPTS